MSNLQVEQSQPVTKEFSIKAILPVILALITGMLLVMLDSTIMNVAIPQLEKTFDASLKTIQWYHGLYAGFIRNYPIGRMVLG